MKTLTTLLAIAALSYSCKKNASSFTQNCNVVIESDYTYAKFITKKEKQEKDAVLFKSSANNQY